MLSKVKFISLCFCLMQFSKGFKLGVTKDELLAHFKTTILPGGIEAHQVPSEPLHESMFMGLVEMACSVLGQEVC